MKGRKIDVVNHSPINIVFFAAPSDGKPTSRWAVAAFCLRGREEEEEEEGEVVSSVKKMNSEEGDQEEKVPLEDGGIKV